MTGDQPIYLNEEQMERLGDGKVIGPWYRNGAIIKIQLNPDVDGVKVTEYPDPLPGWEDAGPGGDGDQ